MKTTIDIPDALYREVKIRAAREGKPIREIVVQALQSSFEQQIVPEREIIFENGLPVIRLGLAEKIPALTNEQIAELLD
jgi:plasmid stability protein